MGRAGQSRDAGACAPPPRERCGGGAAPRCARPTPSHHPARGTAMVGCTRNRCPTTREAVCGPRGKTWATARHSGTRRGVRRTTFYATASLARLVRVWVVGGRLGRSARSFCAQAECNNNRAAKPRARGACKKQHAAGGWADRVRWLCAGTTSPARNYAGRRPVAGTNVPSPEQSERRALIRARQRAIFCAPAPKPALFFADRRPNLAGPHGTRQLSGAHSRARRAGHTP